MNALTEQGEPNLILRDAACCLFCLGRTCMTKAWLPQHDNRTCWAMLGWRRGVAHRSGVFSFVWFVRQECSSRFGVMHDGQELMLYLNEVTILLSMFISCVLSMWHGRIKLIVGLFAWATVFQEVGTNPYRSLMGSVWAKKCCFNMFSVTVFLHRASFEQVISWSTMDLFHSQNILETFRRIDFVGHALNVPNMLVITYHRSNETKLKPAIYSWNRIPNEPHEAEIDMERQVRQMVIVCYVGTLIDHNKQ